MYPLDAWINKDYLKYYMLTALFLKLTTKKDTRVAMPKINQEELNKVLMVLPPLEEQKHIVNKVDKLMKYCDELEAKINQSKADSEMLMQAVLQEAFNN